MKKISTIVGIIIIVIAVIIIFGGVFIYEYFAPKEFKTIESVYKTQNLNGTQAVELKTYINDELGFSFNYPEKLGFIKYDDRVKYFTFYIADKPTTQFLVSARSLQEVSEYETELKKICSSGETVCETTIPSAKGWQRIHDLLLQKPFGPCDSSSSCKIMNINGNKAVSIVNGRNPFTGTNDKSYYFYINKDGIERILEIDTSTYSDSAEKTYDQIVNSVKILKGAFLQTEDWKTYTNSQYGFSFQYPEEQKDNIKGVYFDENEFNLPITEAGINTNIVAKVVHINIKQKISAVCTGPNSGTYNKSSDVVINGIKFLKGTGSDAAAGSGFSHVEYTTEKNSNCITLEFIIKSFNDLHNYNGGEPFTQYDFSKEEPVFSQIISTFNFTK